MPTLMTGQQPAYTSPFVVTYTSAVTTATARWVETQWVEVVNRGTGESFTATTIGGPPTNTTAWGWPILTYYHPGDPQSSEPESEEDAQHRRDQLRRANDEARRRRNEQQDRYRAACARARETLRELLDEENQRRLDAGRDLLVVGSAGGQYRLEYRYAGNVKRNGRTYCAHPRMTTPEGDHLPTDDVLITQILMLQTDEQQFLQIANVS